jgi:D-hydroxyproline dehydrogenase subunit beta
VTSFDVVIIGAGIVGAACARALARAGLQVCVVERHLVGGGATAAGMGHIVVMDDSDAQFALTHFSREAWRTLSPALPAAVEWDTCGTLWVAADEEEMREVLRKAAYYTERGVRVEVLDAHALRNAEPHLRDGLVGGLRVLDDAVLYPTTATHWLLNDVPDPITVMTGREVARIEPGRVFLRDGEMLRTTHVVVATGSSAKELLPSLPVQPRKGHLLITDRHPGYIHHQIIELGYLKSAHAVQSDSVAFNAQPRRTGQILLGSSRQYGDHDASVNPELTGRMLQRALEYLPGLGALSALRIWTGMRAATPDKLPIIGPLDEAGTLWAATGHEGLGITTSLGTAELLASHITGQRAPLDPMPYLPARFLQHTQEAIHA